MNALNALLQTAFLAFTDLRRQLGSPHSAISFVGSIVFVGILFWLLAGFALDHFLNAAFLMVPLLILAPATASITSDREAGYASILFTYPVTATRYYAAKFLALHLLLGVHFLVLVPFLFLILVYGGTAWLGDIAKFAAWAVLETSFVSALGLFLSASFGRRAAAASVYVGFGLALVFVIGPWYIPYYTVALHPETASLLLRFLHYSPMMAALDERGTGFLVAQNPLPSFLATLSVIVSLVALGLVVYRRFQDAEGWDVRRSKAAPVVALGILILLAVPIVPEVSYTALPQGFGTGGCAQTSTLEYCVSFQPMLPGPNDPFQSAPLGSPIAVRISLSLSNEQPLDVTVGKVVLSWSSRFIEFNMTRAEFGRIQVPATSTAILLTNATAVPVRVSSLRLYEGSFAFVPISVELVADGTPLSFDTANAMNVSGPLHNRDIVWGIVGLEAALVLGRRLIRRPRKG